MFRLTRASLANRSVVGLLTALFAVAGVVSLGSLKQELFPSFTAPQLTVLTTAAGASPKVVDDQITVPLSEAVRQVDGVDSVTSTSTSGVSTISVTSDYGLNQDDLAADVKAAIDPLTAQLPENAEPQVVTGALDDLPAMTLTVASDLSTPVLSERLASIVVPELRELAGVRDVTVSGGASQRVTVTTDAKALAVHGITTDQVRQALATNGETVPTGSISQDGGRVSVQVGSPFSSLEQIEALPLVTTTPSAGTTSGTESAPGTSSGVSTVGGATGASDGQVVTIGDVATVKVTNEPATSITRTNGEPALSVAITDTRDADVVSLSAEVNEKLAELENKLGAKAQIVVASDQAPFISESIRHLAIEGGLGLLFAVLIILVFLLSVRSTLVTAISIPLSILVTFLGLYVWGYSLNILTLGALTIAIGRVVDDSIVVIENIKRHLGYGEEKSQAILQGVEEVASAITASTLTTVMVFLPVAITGGLVGELFRPFALTVTIAMLSSLLVALTIVPVLSYWFLKTPKTREASAQSVEEGEDVELNLLQRGYLPMLRRTLHRPLAVLVIAVVLLGGSLSLLPRLGVEFLGSTGENTITATQSFDSSLDLSQVTRQVTKTENLMRKKAGVRDVLVTASLAGGGNTTGAGPSGPVSGDTTATYTVTTTDNVDSSEVQDALEKTLDANLGTGAVTLGSGGGGLGSSTVDVAVTGGDEATLDRAAEQVDRALGDVPETTEVTNDRAAGQTTLRVQVDRVKAASLGLTEQQVSGIVSAAMSPQSAGTIVLDGAQLVLYVGGAQVTTKEQLNAIPLGRGTSLSLGDIAAIKSVSAPSSVARENGDLVATVSLTPKEGQLGTVQSVVRQRLASLSLPDGVKVDVGGASEQQSEAFGQLGLAMLVAIGLIYMLLVGILRSLVQPLILMVSIPFAAIGAIGLLYATGTPLGVAALIGMLMLIGIVVTNAIVLMDLINQYRRRGQSVSDAVYHGAGRRVRPIVMTALATIFALLPMATGITGGGGFISQALAIVVIGGLISSTALTLLLVPALYQLVEGRREGRRNKTKPSASSIPDAHHGT